MDRSTPATRTDSLLVLTAPRHPQHGRKQASHFTPHSSVEPSAHPSRAGIHRRRADTIGTIGLPHLRTLEHDASLPSGHLEDDATVGSILDGDGPRSWNGPFQRHSTARQWACDHPSRFGHTSVMDDSDEAVWSRVRAGDSRTFGVIWDRHHARVFRHLMAGGFPRTDAEDLVAVTFLELWRKRRSVRFVEGSLLPWLIVTARNVARNAARSQRRYERFLAALPAPTPIPDHAGRHEVDDRTAAPVRQDGVRHQHC